MIKWIKKKLTTWFIMESLHLIMKKLQKHSINIFARLLKTGMYLKILPLRSRQWNSVLRIRHKDHPSKTSFKNKMSNFLKRRTLRSVTNFDNWKLFKNDEKCCLFHLKSPFRSQDIYFFVLTFSSCIKTARLGR